MLNVNSKSIHGIIWIRMNLKEDHKKGRGKFRKAIVVLIRNTTWRCGKLERLIVKHLHKESTGLGKPGTPLTDMLQSFKLSGKKRNEFLDAIKRLERRNIVKILSM